MAETPSLSGFAQIYRSGWDPKSRHSVFDYILGSTELLRQAGKAVAGWTTKIGETTIGGQPPTFDDIETDVDLLKKFTNVIFEDDDTDKRWKPKVRETLVMALLLRYDQFCDVLEAHPFAKLVEVNDSPDSFNDHRFTYSSIRDNLFICRVNQALEKAGACDLTFGSWVAEARKSFLEHNAPAIPIETFPLYGGDGKEFLMDVRCFTDHFNALAFVTQAIHMQRLSQKHILNDIRNAFNHESKITSSFIVEKIFNIERTVQRLANHLIGEAPKPDAPPSSGVIRFSISSKSLPKSASLAEVTTAFFVDDYRSGYALDQKSPSWNDLDSQGKKSLRNEFGSIKRAVRMVLMLADSYPLIPEDPSKYKKVVQRIATAAEEQDYQHLQT